jgi:hypothetical protein
MHVSQVRLYLKLPCKNPNYELKDIPNNHGDASDMTAIINLNTIAFH